MADLSVDLGPLLALDANAALAAPAAAESATRLLRAARLHGYAHASKHGVPHACCTRVLQAARRFFDDAPSEERERVRMRAPAHTDGDVAAAADDAAESNVDDGSVANGPYRGYQPLYANVTQERPDAHHALDYLRTLSPPEVSVTADLAPHQTALASRLRGLAHGRNVFPRTRAEIDDNSNAAGDMERAVADLVAHATSAGAAVMRAVALACGASPHAFADAFRDPFWILRLIHYPRYKGTDDSIEALGCGAHRDYGFVTFVFEEDAFIAHDATEKNAAEPQRPTANARSALQVCLAGDGHDWKPALKPPNGDFILNFGDCVEAITGGAIPATLHRVVRPMSRDRLSVAIFIEPNFNWRIRRLIQPCVRRPYDTAAANGSNSTCDDDASRDTDATRNTNVLRGAQLARMEEMSCFGEYLLSKVSSNFDEDALEQRNQ